MSDADLDAYALARLRILRAGGYRCGHRDQTGTLCAAPAHEVDKHHRFPVCPDHAE